MTNGCIQQIISDSDCIWKALNLSIQRSEMIRGGDFGCPSLANMLLIGSPSCLSPKKSSLRSWAGLCPAQGMLLAVIAVALREPSGKSPQKLPYLLKNKYKSLSLQPCGWLNPSGKETSAPAVAGCCLH